MRSISIITVSVFVLVSLLLFNHNNVVLSQNTDSLNDIQIGMQGLMEATKDPALLAQLLKDMQDPEMMAEAAKMRENPDYIKKMKEMTNTKGFKDALKTTKDVLDDPTKAAHAEAKFEHMAKVGNEQIKTTAQNSMEQAMGAIKNDPAVMAEMMKMIKDPSFQTTMASMAKDPQFQNYIAAMKDMMADPEKRKLVEDISQTVKQQLP